MNKIMSFNHRKNTRSRSSSPITTSKLILDYWKDEADPLVEHQSTQVSHGIANQNKGYFKTKLSSLSGKSDRSTRPRKSLQPLAVPHDFKAVLQDFTIAYMIDHPTDVINYGIQYFHNLKIKRSTLIDRTQRRSEGGGLQSSVASGVVSPAVNVSLKLSPEITSMTAPNSSVGGASIKSVKSTESRKPLDIVSARETIIYGKS